MITTYIIGIISLLIIIYFSSIKKGNIGLLFAFILTTIFLSIRYNWGNDYIPYLEIFINVSNYEGSIFDFNSLGELINHGEIGWALLNYAFKYFGFFSLIIFLSVFENIIIYKFICKYVSPKWFWLAFFLYYFNTSFLLMQASMLRQWLAMALFLLSFEYIIKRKLIQFSILILLAISVHNSAIILFPIYFIPYFSKLNFSYKQVILALPLFIAYLYWAPTLFSFTLPNVLDSVEKFSSYSIYNTENTIKTNISIVILLSYGIALISLAQMNYANSRMKILIVINFIATLIIPLNNVLFMVGRLGFYFNLASFAVTPFVIDKLWYKSRLISITILSYIIIYYGYDFFIFFSNKIWMSHYTDFHTIFEVPWQ